MSNINEIEILYSSIDVQGGIILRYASEEKGNVLFLNDKNQICQLTEEDFLREFDLITSDTISKKYQPLNDNLTSISVLDNTEKGFLIKSGKVWSIDESRYVTYDEFNDDLNSNLSKYVKKIDLITINGQSKELGSSPNFDIKTNLKTIINEDNIEIVNDNGDGVKIKVATNTEIGLMSKDDKKSLDNLVSSDGFNIKSNVKNEVQPFFNLHDKYGNYFNFTEVSTLIGNKKGKLTISDKEIFYQTSINDHLTLNRREGIKVKYLIDSETFKWEILPPTLNSSSVKLPISELNKTNVLPINIGGHFANEYGYVEVDKYKGSEYININSNLVISMRNHPHKIKDVDGLIDSLNLKSNINSPIFTGVPKSTTPKKNDKSNRIATTEYVKNQYYITKDDIPTNLPNKESLYYKISNKGIPLKEIAYIGDRKTYIDTNYGKNIKAEYKNGTIEVSVENNVYTATNGIKVDEYNNISPLYGNKINTIAQGNDERFHNHRNLSIIDNISQTNIDSWNDSNNKKHIHSNKIILDGITKKEIERWDSAYEKLHFHDNKYVLDAITKSVFDGWENSKKISHEHRNFLTLESITDENIKLWNKSNENSHFHTNKNILDRITITSIEAWDKAYELSHTHKNIVVLDSITQSNINNWNNAFLNKHSHGNINILDNIKSIDIYNWNYARDKSHEHTNKLVLDDITQNSLKRWDETYSKMHLHNNKVILDKIGKTDIHNWNYARETSHIHSNLSILDNISENMIISWQKSSEDSHTHDNKYILDGITKRHIEEWNHAHQDCHTHWNKAIIDNITEDIFKSWVKSANLSHNHENKYVLDKISLLDYESWKLTSTYGDHRKEGYSKSDTKYSAGKGLSLDKNTFSILIEELGEGNYISDIMQTNYGFVIKRDTLKAVLEPIDNKTLSRYNNELTIGVINGDKRVIEIDNYSIDISKDKFTELYLGNFENYDILNKREYNKDGLTNQFLFTNSDINIENKFNEYFSENLYSKEISYSPTEFFKINFTKDNLDLIVSKNLNIKSNELLISNDIISIESDKALLRGKNILTSVNNMQADNDGNIEIELGTDKKTIFKTPEGLYTLYNKDEDDNLSLEMEDEDGGFKFKHKKLITSYNLFNGEYYGIESKIETLRESYIKISSEKLGEYDTNLILKSSPSEASIELGEKTSIKATNSNSLDKENLLISSINEIKLLSKHLLSNDKYIVLSLDDLLADDNGNIKIDDLASKIIDNQIFKDNISEKINELEDKIKDIIDNGGGTSNNIVVSDEGRKFKLSVTEDGNLRTTRIYDDEGNKTFNDSFNDSFK